MLFRREDKRLIIQALYYITVHGLMGMLHFKIFLQKSQLFGFLCCIVFAFKNASIIITIISMR